MSLYCIFYVDAVDGNCGVNYGFYSSFDSAYDEYNSVYSERSIYRIERSKDREFVCYEA